LVAAHSNSVSALAAGMKALPTGTRSFAHTQALWRFLANERTTPQMLIEPVLAHARAAVGECCNDYALVAHDWSRLNFNQHASKADRVTMTHATDIGYELQSSVLIDDCQGDPVGALAQNLVMEQGVWSTYRAGCQAQVAHLDELSERMRWLEQTGLSKPLVHIVDREADSIAHLRAWHEAEQRFVIRAKEGRIVQYAGESLPLRAVAERLTFQHARDIDYQGTPAVQKIAAAMIVIDRPAKPKRSDAAGARVAPVPGEPLSVRLIVSRIEDTHGKLIAMWYLLSNVDATVANERVALWYYWRWRIESYFKLLKGAGQQVESWEQETGLAILKRILIASHACALAWALQRATDPDTQATAAFVVRLSGRQMKRSQPITASALLAGLYQLFAMLEILEHHSLDELKAHAQLAFPQFSRLWS
jgi:hypothetical protein